MHKTINHQGYHLKTNVCESEFIGMCRELGNTVGICEVRPSIQSRYILNSNKEMGLHTDSPEVNYIAWHCIYSAKSGGASLILDFNTVLQQLSPQEINLLKSIPVKIPTGTTTSIAPSCPIYSEQGLYYADWLIEHTRFNAEQLALHTKLKQLLLPENALSITLQPKDVLIIDNKRMLHGRTAFINGPLPRHLTRHWIVAPAIVEK